MAKDMAVPLTKDAMLAELASFTDFLVETATSSGKWEKLLEGERSELLNQAERLRNSINSLTAVIGEGPHEHSQISALHGLWSAISAAYIIGNSGAMNPVTKRVVRDAVWERAARARSNRRTLSDDDILRMAEPLWNNSKRLRRSAEETAKAILRENQSLRMKYPSLGKRLRPLMRKIGYLHSRSAK